MEQDSADDDFRAAMQDVQPLNKGRRREQKSVVEDGIAQQNRRDAAQGRLTQEVDPNYLTLSDVPAKQPLEYLEWKKDGVQDAVFSKLRRGQYALEGSLDLHGKTVKEARQSLFGFIALASAKHWRCVVVAHGKGELSRTPGRLKSYVAAWLAEHREVIAFSSAMRQHGGVGAVYVLVRKSEQSKEDNREQYGLRSSD